MSADKTLIQRRFDAGLERYEQMATVQKKICNELAVQIGKVVSDYRLSMSGNSNHVSSRIWPPKIMEIGIGTGFMTRLLARNYPKSEFILNDLVPRTREFTDQFLSNVNAEYTWGDAEQIAFPNDIDMIVSASTVQWFDSLEDFFKKCHYHSSKESLLAFSTFGPHNFSQITTLTGNSLPYFTLDQIGQMLQNAGYESLDMEEYVKEMCFDSPTEVLRHIKATGVNGIREERWTASRLARFENEYRQLCPEKIILTYHPQIIVAKRK